MAICRVDQIVPSKKGAECTILVKANILVHLEKWVIAKNQRNEIRRDEPEFIKSYIYAFELSHINNEKTVSITT